MKQQTKKKLIELANTIIEKGNWNKKEFMELMDSDNYLTILKRFGDKWDIIIHRVTLEKYTDYLLGRLNEIWIDRGFDKVIEEVVEDIKRVEDIREEVFVKVPVSMILACGSDEELGMRVRNMAVKRKWTGLFDYVNEERVVIRLGKYKGCNVKSNASLRQYFQSPLDLYGFVINCLNEDTIEKIRKFRDKDELDMNIKTLEELKERIVASNFGRRFPTLLKRKGN